MASAASSACALLSGWKPSVEKVCLFNPHHPSPASHTWLSSSPSSIDISLVLLDCAKPNSKNWAGVIPLWHRRFPCLWVATNFSREAGELIDSCADVNNRAEVAVQETVSEHFSILEEIGFPRRDVKLLIWKNQYLLDQTAASITSNLEALQALGVKGDSLMLLVRKRPSVLTINLEPIVLFIQKNIQGFDTEKFHRVLFKANRQWVVGFPERVKLLLRRGLPSSQLASVLNRLNLKVFCEKPIEELDGVVSFLKRYDEKNESCGLVIRHPALLQLSLQRGLLPRTAFFEKLGGDHESLKKLFRRFPVILAYTVEHLETHVAYLKSAGFTDDSLLTIIKAYPQILSLSIERKLQPRIEFLKNCGLNHEEIAKLLIKQPTFLGLSFDDNLSKKVSLLLKIGFKSYSFELAMALSTVTRISVEKLRAGVDLLLSYGLTYEDICSMARKQPHILRYTSESMKPKIDYLVNNMSRSARDLVSFPAFLGYSLEDRIKPRHEIMKWLIARGLAKANFSLNRLLAVSDKDFTEMAIEKGFVMEANQ